MPNFLEFNVCGDSKILTVRFTCGRCGKIYYEAAEVQWKNSHGSLSNYRPPKGWLDSGLHNPVLCDDCAKQYKLFLQNKGDVHEKETT